MASPALAGLAEMVGIVQSHQRGPGGPLLLRLSPDVWRTAYQAGTIGRGPDMWPAPAGPGAYRRVSVVVGQGQVPGSWQLLDGATGEVISTGTVATGHGEATR